MQPRSPSCRTMTGAKGSGRLGVRPVLERHRQRFPRPLPERLEHGTKPPVQPLIPKIASGGSASTQLCPMSSHHAFGAT